MQNNIENIITVIDHIENNLNKKSVDNHCIVGAFFGFSDICRKIMVLCIAKYKFYYIYLQCN